MSLHSLKFDHSLTREVLFTDLNSNTSSICATTWLQTNTNNNVPTEYVLCNEIGNEEIFQWHFVSYTSLKQFSIEFMHGWNDPAWVFSCQCHRSVLIGPREFAPPYEYVGMFSTDNSFNLTCAQMGGIERCYLPQSQSPYRAVINALTN